MPTVARKPETAASSSPLRRGWPLAAAVILAALAALLLTPDTQPAQAQSADVTEPVLVVGSVTGNILTLNFNEDLDYRSAPAGSAFEVRVPRNSAWHTIAGTGTAAMSYATPAARIVTVSLAENVRHAERAEVIYTKPAQKPLKDKAGNVANSFHRGLVNETPDTGSDTTPPTFASAEVSETTLKVTFNENLDIEGPGTDGSAFSVSVTRAGTATTIAGTGKVRTGELEWVNPRRRTLVPNRVAQVTLEGNVFHGETVTVKYTKPTQFPLQDRAANAVATFTSTSGTVTNNTPLPKAIRVERTPTLGGPLGSATAYNRVRITFDQPLDDTSRPAGSAFTVSQYVPASFSASGGIYNPAREVTFNVTGPPTIAASIYDSTESTVTVTLDGEWSHTHSISVTYTKPTSGNRLRDKAGNEVLSFTYPPPPPSPPVIQSATVDRTTLTLTFDKELNAASKPASSAFIVTLDDLARASVTSGGVAISGKTVALTLDHPARASQEFNVRYRKPSTKPLQDTDGLDVATFGDLQVTNNSTLLWTTRLTAGPSGSGGYGCRTGSSTTCTNALIDYNFTFGGTDYQINILAAGVASDSLGFVELELDQEVPTAWTLHVGTNSLAVSSATRSNGNKNARWHPVNWGIGNGDKLTVSLMRPAPQPVSDPMSDSAGATQDEVTVVSSQPTPEPVSDPPSDFSLATKSEVPVVSTEPTSEPTPEPAQTAPSVTGVNVSSSPASGDTYKLGETISVALTFSGNVDVDTSGGTPSLNIDMSPLAWGTKAASYASGTGTTTLTFMHTVVEPNYSTQGIAVLGDSLALNGGTIKSSASQEDAELSHTNLNHDPKHKVDWQQSPPAPTVTGVNVSSSPASGDTYKLGETITVTLTFSEAVTVTGSPRLKIDMDPAHWGEKWASYASGSGTDSLTFTHTVVRPNYSTQGIAVLADSLALNGGTIRSSASNANADLSHANRNHDANHKVDWRLPDEGPGS